MVGCGGGFVTMVVCGGVGCGGGVSELDRSGSGWFFFNVILIFLYIILMYRIER